jgi:hypothetical protein
MTRDFQITLTKDPFKIKQVRFYNNIQSDTKNK